MQEHHASALHWDFRLERDGVLVSWAVPKGLPTDPAVNRLAVHVEDHPLEYASYEGTIGDGQYGSGAVTIWDSGTYRTEKWTDREVKVVLDGHRVHGRFVLFQTGGKNWMMHRMDSPPDPGWLRLPDRLAPMMASEGSLPRGTGWAYEMHWAGVRALVRVEGGRIDVRNADGDDLARRVPGLRALGARLGTTQVLFDGVLVQFGAEKKPLTYLIFDVAHLDGRSLLAMAYRERREVLNGLQLAGPTWQVPPVFEGHGREALRVSQRAAVERRHRQAVEFALPTGATLAGLAVGAELADRVTAQCERRRSLTNPTDARIAMASRTAAPAVRAVEVEFAAGRNATVSGDAVPGVD